MYVAFLPLIPFQPANHHRIADASDVGIGVLGRLHDAKDIGIEEDVV